MANRVITIRCTRSRGPRGFFCLQVDRRGPVIVDVIHLAFCCSSDTGHFHWRHKLSDGDTDFPFRSNTDGAFTKQELRDGIPLDYIAGKLKSTLEGAHRLCKEIEAVVPDDLPQPEHVAGTSYSTKNDGLLSPAQHVFASALIAYLGLYNFLAVANTQFEGETSQTMRLLNFDSQEFETWLDDVTRRGSLTEISDLNLSLIHI